MRDWPSSDPMPLRKVQENLLQWIFGAEAPQDPALVLYREMTRLSIQETLDILYPMTKNLFEADPLACSPTWEILCDRFIMERFPVDFRINWVGQKFPEWLPGPPWMKELADYEWALFEASNCRDPLPQEWLNPSLFLRGYEYSIPAWVRSEGQEVRPSRPQKEAPTLSCVAIFYDYRKDRVRTLELQPAALDLLSQWQAGATPMSSAQRLADQLNQSFQKIQLQIEPLLKMLTAEGVLVQLLGTQDEVRSDH